MSSDRIRYRFGLFEADAHVGSLVKQGRAVRLQEQPFQVLIALLERHADLVTREELRERLWPGDTFVEFDKSLGVALTKVRAALGDDAANPRFIETVPKRGYRFIAPVTVESAGLQVIVPPAVEATASAPKTLTLAPATPIAPPVPAARVEHLDDKPFRRLTVVRAFGFMVVRRGCGRHRHRRVAIGGPADRVGDQPRAGRDRGVQQQHGRPCLRRIAPPRGVGGAAAVAVPVGDGRRDDRRHVADARPRAQ